MPRYDFSSAVAFQVDVVLDMLLVAVLSLALSAVIGRWISRWIFTNDADAVFSRLIAPALGLGVLVALADGAARLFGLTAFLVLMFAGAGIVVAWAAMAAQWRSGSVLAGPRLPLAIAVTGAVLLTLPPMTFLFPWFDGDALYFGRGIYDHIKTAIIDTIAREGMPPRTPYVSLEGAAVLLNYYYGWHLLAAVLRGLPGVSALGADLGLTAATAISTFTTVSAVAWRLRPERSTLYATLLFLGGMSLGPGLLALAPSVGGLFVSKAHGISNAINQASWVPQHLASALFVVLALLVAGAIMDAPRQHRVVRGLVLGLLVAAGVMSSAWVGGAFLFAAAALALPVLLGLQSYRAPLLRAAPVMFGAALVAVFLASGYLLHLRGLAGVAAQGSGYVGFGAYETSLVIPPRGLGAIFNIVNFMTVYAVINLGALYPAGLYGLYGTSEGQSERRPAQHGLAGFAMLARVIVPSALLAACVMRSTLVHNDFSWRGVLIPVLLLTMFGGPTLGALFDRVRQGGGALRHKVALAAAGVALVLALASTRFHFSHYVLADATTPQRAQHRIMLDAGRAWARVQALTDSAAIIMAGPAAFSAVSFPEGNLPWALFGDRRLLVTDYEWGVIFAHHVDEARVEALDKLQRRIFANGGSSADLADLAGRHGVSAILVAPGDGIAGSNSLAAGGHFQLAERTGGFEIHVRRAR